MHRGWTQVAFRRDLRDGLNVVRVGKRPILLVRTETGVEAYPGICPHRGASLGHGGRLVDGGVVCPFHGLRIGLGCKGPTDAGFVPALPVLDWQGLVLVGPARDHHDAGLSAFVASAEAWTMVPGFSLVIEAPPRWVIENAFDALHFVPVHGVLSPPPMRGGQRDGGAYVVESRFALPPSPWQTGRDKIEAPYSARAFSPTLVVAQLDGVRPYRVVTSALDQGGHSKVFLSIGLPSGHRTVQSDIDYLLGQMRAGLEQDRPIWENLDSDHVASFQPGDEAVVGFRAFCGAFEEAAA